MEDNAWPEPPSLQTVDDTDANAVAVDDEVDTTSEEDAPVEDSDLTKVAREVLAGKWGLGVDRRRDLAEAGHDPNAVKKEIVRLLNESP